MVIDNRIYSQLADTWWTEDTVLCLLRMHVNPCRFAYFREIIARMKINPRECRVLDIGCGGGFLSEEFARLGCRVVGVDASAESLETARARRHQRLRHRLSPCLRRATTLRRSRVRHRLLLRRAGHVRDLPAVIAEISRVLKPGSPFFFDTINRTWRSWFFYIKVAQDWDSMSYMPPNLHDWKMFIKPAELRVQLSASGLDMQEVLGFLPSIGPLKVISELRKLKRGEMSFGDYARQMQIVRLRDVLRPYGTRDQTGRIGGAASAIPLGCQRLTGCYCRGQENRHDRRFHPILFTFCGLPRLPQCFLDTDRLWGLLHRARSTPKISSRSSFRTRAWTET